MHRFKSLEARALFGMGYDEEARDVEACHLIANGRVERHHVEPGQQSVNGPGDAIDNAKLDDFWEETNTVVIQVNHSQIPEFHMRIQLPLDKLEAFVRKRRSENTEKKRASKRVTKTKPVLSKAKANPSPEPLTGQCFQCSAKITEGSKFCDVCKV